MPELTESVAQMISEFEKLPGLGKKSAERIAYHLLKIDKAEALALADSVRAVKENVRYCKECYNLAEDELCAVCKSPNRSRNVLCVVEQPQDILLLEQTGQYDGVYHVLLGRLSPLEKITPEQLTIAALLNRIKSGTFSEVIMATNPTVEGDQTAFYIIRQLESLPNKPNVTRLARGIVTGSDIRFANTEMLADALSERQLIR
ncbi:MAG: recombination mediator RecR [Planctomycetaceae bacterium]|jgi:recombination protein RecR|nr:recombination mediator RecR [Planctomycetaceae bacterium]